MNKCIDCDKKITDKSIRCRKCFGIKHSKRMSGKNNPSYKHGLPRCKLCGAILSDYHCKICKVCTHNLKLQKETCKCGSKKSKISKSCMKCDSLRKSLNYRTKGNPMYGKVGKLNPNYNNHKLKGIKRPDITGRKHPLWEGGISKLPYSFEFTQELKEEIRKSDNHLCQKCYKKGMVVHHIDYNKNNSKETNLITLCNKCNPGVNKNRKYWKKYFKRIIQNIIKRRK